MDRLSSCYFCGAAPDATLEEHPVVPESLDPGAEAQTTAVLCRTCSRKLDAVLDTVVGAVEDGDATAGTGPGGDAASADSASGEGTGDDLESTLGDDEEILTPLGDDESTAEEAAEASDMEFGDDREADGADDDGGPDDGDDPSKARKYTRSRGAGFRKEDDDTVESGSLTGGAFDDGDDEDEGDSESLTGGAFSDDGDDAGSGRSTAADGESSDPLAGGSADESAESGSGTSSSEKSSAGSSPDDGSGGQSSSDQSSGGPSGGDTSDSDGDHRVSMTRLENTKVMRLLENREFPVDKEEFVVVAANAYQVSQSDCEKVIDLAVEHGLLREEDGQLYGGDA
ncbi:hypothetical protein [Halosimplex halobium]|uniref:hypothetical protein n=1 Tax=Halosimplex halobium TaxID=3396618 RepID=UPI003F556B8B